MGFYGNITNTSNTTFSFDRIYPNRLAMDANANNDGIFIGRYVLVEYQEEAAYPVAYHAVETSEDSGQYYFYSSTNQEEISKIKYLGLPPGEPDRLPSVDDVNAIYQDGFYKGEILQRYIYSSEKKDWIFSKEFYACVGEDNKHFAIFELITDPSMKSHYIQNFEIDEKHYGQESKGFKGYDSTVWVKSSVEQNGKLITKYINIADLNSVVPTFDIAADAPTMTPITPHFDADSTNVYYKLHAQPQWGFRIAQTSADKSDETTQWVKDFYDPATDTSRKKYASGVTNGIPNWNSEIPVDLNAAIYFNEAGFKKQLIGTDERNGEIKKHSKTVTENAIKIEATGKSGNEYNTHNGKEGPTKTQQIDTQEITINLPAIGNMMSDAWDIIHGPNRDDAQTDENSSLQGRLDSFKAMEKDAIPMKRNSDGTFVGSRINGNSNRTVETNKILEENLSTSFDQDDAWIRTEVDTTDLDNINKLSGISIHHTWHKQADTTSTTNKNNDNVSSSQASDKIDLYTPIVDKAGHVVGKNTETVTLPYGYKTFTTNGLVNETDEDLDTSAGRETVASNTQDTLAIDTKNKWLQIEITNDKIELAHEIHDTTNSTDTTDWTQTEANTTIPTITYEFDNAGHYVSHHTENYKLPFGYGKIVGDVGNSAATATYDQIKFTSDEWLTATITEEGEDNTTVVTYSHDYPNEQEDTSTDFDMNTATTQDNKDKIVLETLKHDSTGHIINVNQHTVTLPYGYKTVNVNNSEESTTPTKDIKVGGQSAQDTQDVLNINASNKWVALDNTENNTIKIGHTTPFSNKQIISPKQTTVTQFGDSFNLINLLVDEAGHVIQYHEDEITITIPQGDHENINNIDNNGNVIPTTNLVSNIELDKPTGKITARYNTTNSIKLSGYETNKNNNHSTDINAIADNDTLNTAFAKLQNQIDNEIKLRKAAIDTLYYGEESPDGVKIAETFDTIKEIADFLEQDSSNGRSGVEVIIDNIDTLNGNDTVSGSVANSIKNAKTDILNTKFKYGVTEEQKTIAELMDKVAELETKLNELNNQINPPQEPDEGGETL